MTEPVADAFGPPPFVFHPAGGAMLRSRAYSLTFRLLATALVFGAAAWLVSLLFSGRLGAPSGTLASWFLAAIAMMAWTWWCIVRSVTTLDDRELKQTWIWTKRMELRELAFARVIRFRGLEWLVAPRIYVRTLLGKFAVFYAAEPAMVAEFDRLAAELAAFRGR